MTVYTINYDTGYNSTDSLGIFSSEFNALLFMNHPQSPCKELDCRIQAIKVDKEIMDILGMEE